MFSSIIATLAGSAAKVAVVTTVAAASVGGAFVSDSIDVPLLEDSSTVEVDNAPDELAFDDAITSDEEAVEEEVVVEEEAVEDEVVVDDSEDEATDDDDGESDKPANHGSEVSAFVHETELKGCEKGHAVAALASGKAEKADKECPDHGDDESEAGDADETHAEESGDDGDEHVDDADHDSEDESQAVKTDNGNQGKSNNGKKADK